MCSGYSGHILLSEKKKKYSKKSKFTEQMLFTRSNACITHRYHQKYSQNKGTTVYVQYTQDLSNIKARSK